MADLQDNNTWRANIQAFQNKQPLPWDDLTLPQSTNSKWDFSLAKSRKNTDSMSLHVVYENKQLWFNSRFDPVAEAQQRSVKFAESNTILCLGWQAPYLWECLLKAGKKVIVLEYDLDYLSGLLALYDFRDCLTSSQFIVLVAPQINELIEKGFRCITEIAPALFLSPVAILPNEARKECQPYPYHILLGTLQSICKSIETDLQTQAKLAPRWHNNMLLNLQSEYVAQSSPPPPCTQQIIHLIAAGPSLEMSVNELSSDDYIICSDTAYPLLVQKNIIPKIVLSIDSQLYSYHHYLYARQNFKNKPSQSPYFCLDMGITPSLLSSLAQMGRYGFLTSPHPLMQYFHRSSKVVSGGSVMHTALLLANYLNAPKVKIHGMDMAYYKTQTYARESYLYPYFTAQSNKFLNLEQQMFEFYEAQLDKQQLRLDPKGQWIAHIITAKQQQYRHEMHALLKKMGCSIDFSHEELIPTFEITLNKINLDDFLLPQFHIKAKKWREYKSLLEQLLEQWRNFVQSDESANLERFTASLSSSHCALWQSILPLLTHYLESGLNTTEALVEIVGDTKINLIATS